MYVLNMYSFIILKTCLIIYCWNNFSYKNSLSSGFMDRKGTHLSVKYPKSMYITKFLRNSLCPILRRTALQRGSEQDETWFLKNVPHTDTLTQILLKTLKLVSVPKGCCIETLEHLQHITGEGGIFWGCLWAGQAHVLACLRGLSIF